MNVKELMTGDIISVVNWGSTIVIGCDVRDNLLIVSRNGCVMTTTADDADPLPLTPEILELNGFEKKHPDNPKLTYWIIRRGGGVVNAKMHRGRLFVRMTGIPAAGDFFTPGCQGYIDFVHQLQHALKWCKMADLADNFKVE